MPDLISGARQYILPVVSGYMFLEKNPDCLNEFAIGYLNRSYFLRGRLHARGSRLNRERAVCSPRTRDRIRALLTASVHHRGSESVSPVRHYPPLGEDRAGQVPEFHAPDDEVEDEITPRRSPPSNSLSVIGARPRQTGSLINLASSSTERSAGKA